MFARWEDIIISIAGYGGFCFNDGNQEAPGGLTDY